MSISREKGRAKARSRVRKQQANQLRQGSPRDKNKVKGGLELLRDKALR